MTPKRLTKRPFEIPAILRWADAFRETTGRWPTLHSGRIAQVPFESWFKVDAALRLGSRGLPGGSSLARLLVEHRGVRNTKAQRPLSIGQILRWADVHHQRTGRWPTSASGLIPDSGGEKWKGITRTNSSRKPNARDWLASLMPCCTARR